MKPHPRPKPNHDLDLEERLRLLAPKVTSSYRKEFSARLYQTLAAEMAAKKSIPFPRFLAWSTSVAAVLCLAALLLNSSPSPVAPLTQVKLTSTIVGDGTEGEIFVPQSKNKPIVLGDDGQIYRVLVNGGSLNEGRSGRRLVTLNSF